MSLGATTSAPASTWLTRGAREQLEAAVVVHVAVDDHAAVAVRRVLAEADVGQQHELGEARPQRAQRLLDDAVVLPRAGRLARPSPPGRRRGSRARTPRRASSSTSRNEPLDVVARHPRQLLVRERLGRDEERHHELVEREPRLAHEPAQRRRAAKAAEPGDREGAHARDGTPRRAQAAGAGGASGADSAPRRGSSPISTSGASVGHSASSIRSAKNSHAARPAASSGSATRIPGKP